MRSISSLIHKLKTDYPTVTFLKADQFSWSPSTRTVSYNPEFPYAKEQLLHEASHAVLNHQAYKRDIELLALEAEAWDTAAELAKRYHVALSSDVAEDNLDTYRDWLHARSTCPECTANGYQINATTYECVACTQQWTVNEARLCALRRRMVSSPL